MTSFKMILVLAAMLLATVLAIPTSIEGVDYTINSIKILDDDVPIKDDLETAIIDGEDVWDLPNEENFDEPLEPLVRAPEEKAVFVAKKTEAGYARTTRVGLTVQKGTSGIICFRIRAKAVTLEKIKLKAKAFSASLTKSQQKEFSKLRKKEKDGDYFVSWLEFLGLSLKKKTSEPDFLKKRSKTIQYDKLAVKAKKLLKEVTVQKIEVKGCLKAKGVSFIPTTVFSFLRLARVVFQDDSKLLVLSKHSGGGNVVAATGGGELVPSEPQDDNLITII